MEIINPKNSQTTKEFTISVHRFGTQTVYTWRNNIPGVYIKPGNIINGSVQSLVANAVISKMKIMDYIFKFTP